MVVQYFDSLKLKYEQLKSIDLMSLAQRMYFLQDVFQMTAIALISIINHNGQLFNILNFLIQQIR